ncbi:MAG: epoxyqueuosine reductase, partial [Peptococcaceae bacterium]|nr:epoxyqueuosine reductase [Peptococcaceae bacterium]
MRFYKPPLLAYGSASDDGFKKLKEPGVVGAHHMLPSDWIPDAKTVISIFMPFSDRVIQSNIKDPVIPSMEWRYARIDGQQHLLSTGALVRDALTASGHQAVMPQADDRYWAKVRDDGDRSRPLYSSNWSERHVAFVTGLGTFGLMTNIISKAGSCGRLISVVTDWETAPDEKDYAGMYDYCSKCKVCFLSCPGEAFGEDGKKSIMKCQAFIGKM